MSTKPCGQGVFEAWFNPGWQPQAQLGDGKAPKAVQPSPNPSDLRLPPTIELQINVTRNRAYLNHAVFGLLFGSAFHYNGRNNG
jgi:hypothetical protein